MKKLSGLVMFAFFATTLTAQVLPVKLAEYVKKYDSYGFLVPGKELNNFQVEYGENKLIMQIVFDVTDYKKLAVQKGLHLTVTKTGVTNQPNLLDWYWKPLVKNAPIYTDFGFQAGEYTIILADNDDPSKVFAKRTITVKPNAAKVANTADGFEYDRSHFKIWTCQAVDDKTWKPITPISKIKAGACVTLFFDSKDKLKNKGSMRWGIYKVSADGSEMLVAQKDQGVSLSLEQWSKLYYEECDEFRTPGKYRIYITARWNTETLSNTNSDNYYSKTDLEVE